MSDLESQASHLLVGQERLAFLPALGRVMRQGAPSELYVSDLDRLLIAIEPQQIDRAAEYFSLINRTHVEMAFILFERSIEWPNALAKFRTSEEERACTRRCFDLWLTSCESINASREAAEALGFLRSVFVPERCKPGLSETYRRELMSGRPSLIEPYVGNLESRSAEIPGLMREGCGQYTRIPHLFLTGFSVVLM